MACSNLTVKAKEAARLLGISVSHFFNLKKSGRFGPEAKRLGRSVVYLCSELEAWLGAGAPPQRIWAARQKGGQAR